MTEAPGRSSRSDEPRPADAVAEVIAVASQASFLLRQKTWHLLAEPRNILIGSEPQCDWVLEGPNVLPRQCLLRWDGQHLIASVFDGSSQELIIGPDAAMRVGSLELMLRPLLSVSPPPNAWDDHQPTGRQPLPRRADATGLLPPKSSTRSRGHSAAGEIATDAVTRQYVRPNAEPTVLVDQRLEPTRLTPRRRNRVVGAVRRAALTLPLLGIVSDGQLKPVGASPTVALAAAAANGARSADAHAAGARSARVAIDRSVAVAAATTSASAGSSSPASTTGDAATPQLSQPPTLPPSQPVSKERRAAAAAAYAKVGADCRALPPAARATPEEHVMLQLAIEAYQTGLRRQAQLLFQSLVCRPEVGPPARFMSQLLVMSTAPADLPSDRRVRVRRLLDETELETEEHPELWAQNESLASADLANPKLLPFEFKDQPKCNIFIGEMLFRAGFVPPGTPAPGRSRAAYPSVNQMIAMAERLAGGQPWDPTNGLQWFDVVPKNAAAPGDLVLIAGKDRGDRASTEHGHVEIIRDIVYGDGRIKSVSTVGARASGARADGKAGRIFGVLGRGSYQFSEFTALLRPRMR
jgi:hypothetical protein